ncbi:MAG: beta-ACP synthase, partial [Bacteroidales bacterium]|nr:beta-ACP synthase [Bacteroidales bacterium]
MPYVYISSDNIISSLGFNSKENISNIKKNITGIKLIDDSNISPTPFYASLIDSERLYSDFKKFDNPEDFTRFEQMAILSIIDALRKTKVDIKNKNTLLIISTTKGNIDILEQSNKNRFDNKKIYLWNTAKLLQHYFENPNMPVIVSNACISGLLGIIIGSRLIQSSQFENVIVTGGDILSEFVVSGFQSFLSLSTVPCRPFDVSRDGLSLGEGFGTIILTSNPEYVNEKIIVTGGSSSNDANHISGPSRTGEGLYITIKNTLKEAGAKSVNHIDYISAHGTGTVYNDEMESKAITRAGLENVPVNSFKGYWGHTLGAAGIVESIAAINSMKENTLYKTMGFNKSGV